MELAAEVPLGYEADARFYDLFRPPEPRAATLALVQEHATLGGEVVELGAGTGGLALALAARGLRVTCVEPSPAMRGVLLTKLLQRPELHTLVTLLPGSAERFALPQPAPLIVCFGVLHHLVDDAARRAAVRTIHDQLSPHGLFLCELGLTALGEQPLHLSGERSLGAVTYRKFSSRAVRGGDVYEARYIYELSLGDEMIERVAARSLSRAWTSEQLQELLRDAGFIEWELYGDDLQRPFASGMQRMLIRARRS